MAIKIKFNDPRKNPDNLPDGVSLVQVNSAFTDHYTVYAQNSDYPQRTEIGNVKRHAEGHFVMEVKYQNWIQCGWTCGEKSYGRPHIKDVNEAIQSLYFHRLDMISKGVIKHEKANN